MPRLMVAQTQGSALSLVWRGAAGRFNGNRRHRLFPSEASAGVLEVDATIGRDGLLAEGSKSRQGGEFDGLQDGKREEGFFSVAPQFYTGSADSGRRHPVAVGCRGRAE